jgi:hypothetical protein
MAAVHPPSPSFVPTFSGHETFVLRSNWLKKAYDLLRVSPSLFAQEDAFVRLGVGKNMAQSIRHWGRVCKVFERAPDGIGLRPTALADALFHDETGWDPFLVTPAGRWLLHWQIAFHPDGAYTWFVCFNQLRRSEWTSDELARQIGDRVALWGLRPPSDATLSRDIDCMLRCYLRPEPGGLDAAEDALHCPLNALGLIQAIPGQATYRMVGAARPDLPDALVAYAALQQARLLGRLGLAFNELAYGERSPGRLFRLDEDALLLRLYRLRDTTRGAVEYSEHGGIRQLLWRAIDNPTLDRSLLEAAFAEEPVRTGRP